MIRAEFVNAHLWSNNGTAGYFKLCSVSLHNTYTDANIHFLLMSRVNRMVEVFFGGYTIPQENKSEPFVEKRFLINNYGDWNGGNSIIGISYLKNGNSCFDIWVKGTNWDVFIMNKPDTLNNGAVEFDFSDNTLYSSLPSYDNQTLESPQIMQASLALTNSITIAGKTYNGAKNINIDAIDCGEF